MKNMRMMITLTSLCKSRRIALVINFNVCTLSSRMIGRMTRITLNAFAIPEPTDFCVSDITNWMISKRPAMTISSSIKFNNLYPGCLKYDLLSAINPYAMILVITSIVKMPVKTNIMYVKASFHALSSSFSSYLYKMRHNVLSRMMNRMNDSKLSVYILTQSFLSSLLLVKQNRLRSS